MSPPLPPPPTHLRSTSAIADLPSQRLPFNMPPLTSSQKLLLTQFMSITGVPERSAQKLLKASTWKLEQACERHPERVGRVRNHQDRIHQYPAMPTRTLHVKDWDKPETRIAFLRYPNAVLTRTKYLYDVNTHYIIYNSIFSRSGQWRHWDATYRIGRIADTYGEGSTALLATLTPIERVAGVDGQFLPPYNAYTRYIISGLEDVPKSTVNREILSPKPRPESLYTPQACQSIWNLRRSQGYDRNKCLAERQGSISPVSRVLRSLKSCVFQSRPQENLDGSEEVRITQTTVIDSEPDVFLSRLDCPDPFELRNPVLMASSSKESDRFGSSRLQPVPVPVATDCVPPDPCTHLFTSGQRDNSKCIDWVKGKIELERLQFANQPSLHSYFGSNGTTLMTKERDTLSKLFEKYRDPKVDEADNTSVDGTMKYLADLDINMETAEFLVPLEIVQAPAFGEMTKDGYVEGWKNVTGTTPDTISKQKAYVVSQIKLMKTEMALFKRVYRHAFICSKEKGQKALPLENALVYWEMLFGPSGRPWVTSSTNWTEMWIEFLNAKWTKSVNKDMWNQTFEFYQKTLQDETLSFWSEDGAWPGVIDDFVAYAKEKRGDVPESMETD